MTTQASSKSNVLQAPPRDAATTGFFSILKRAGAAWVEHNDMRLSAALALYSILSLAPMLVITFKIVGKIWRTEDSARQQIMQQLTALMGKQGAEAIQPMLQSAAHHHGSLVSTVLSTLVLVFSATGVFVELQDAMNLIWGVKPAPKQGLYAFIRTRLISVGMVFGIAFLLLVSMFVSTFLLTAAHWILGDKGWIAVVVGFGASSVVVWVLFAAIFKFLPDVQLTWRHVGMGALVTAVLFTLGKFGLALYFQLDSPTSAFGAAGSLAAVMLWIYYSAFILFFGAEFTKIWTLDHDGKVRVEPFAVPLDAQPTQESA